MPTTPKASPDTLQVGRSGELLVQYKLLKFGIDSAPMTTDRGVDLVAIESSSKRTVSIQVKTATHREGGSWIIWSMTKQCVADYVAAVDLRRDKGWLFTKDEFERLAKSGRWLWWYIPGHRPKRAKSTPEEHFARYEIDVVIPGLFPPRSSSAAGAP